MKKILLPLALVSLVAIPKSYAEIPSTLNYLPLENERKNQSQGITPEEQYILDRIEQNKSQELLKEERTRKQAMAGWRQYGFYYYNWRNWKLAPNGTRTSVRTISEREITRKTARTDSLLMEDIAVTCKGLKISRLSSEGWGKWNNPDQGETEMMMALCGNIPGAPKAPVRTKVLPPPITKRDSETCTGSRIECATEDVTSSDTGRSSNPFSYSLPKPKSKCGGNLVCNVLDVFF